MTRFLVTALAAVWLLSAPVLAEGKANSHPSHSHGSRHHSGDSSIRCTGCPRDAHGHIKRSPEAKHAFRSSHPCPSTGRTSGACPGYEIDHRQPLYKGGADSPDNMQWLSKEQHRAKTRAERSSP